MCFNECTIARNTLPASALVNTNCEYGYRRISFAFWFPNVVTDENPMLSVKYFALPVICPQASTNGPTVGKYPTFETSKNALGALGIVQIDR
jgi:hypothetical protein